MIKLFFNAIDSVLMNLLVLTVRVSKSGKVDSSILNYLWFMLVVTKRRLKLKIHEMKKVLDYKIQMLQKEIGVFRVLNDKLIEL